MAQCAVWQNVSYYRANAAIKTKMLTRIDIKHKLGGDVSLPTVPNMKVLGK